MCDNLVALVVIVNIVRLRCHIENPSIVDSTAPLRNFAQLGHKNRIFAGRGYLGSTLLARRGVARLHIELEICEKKSFSVA